MLVAGRRELAAHADLEEVTVLAVNFAPRFNLLFIRKAYAAAVYPASVPIISVFVKAIIKAAIGTSWVAKASPDDFCVCVSQGTFRNFPDSVMYR